MVRLIAAYREGVEVRLRAAEQERSAAEARAIEYRKRQRVQLALAAAVGILLVGAGGVGWWQDRQATAVNAEAGRRAASADQEVRSALEAMTALCARADRETDNPPRCQLTLAAARASFARATTAQAAATAADAVREAGARLKAAESVLETAKACEGWTGELISAASDASAGPGPTASLVARAEAALALAGAPPPAAGADGRAAAIRAHPVRYPLTVVFLFLDGIRRQQAGGKQPTADGLAAALLADVHPLQEATRRAIKAGTLSVFLAGPPGDQLTGSELVCLALALMTDPAADWKAGSLIEEAHSRNPADLCPMLFMIGRRTGSSYVRIGRPASAFSIRRTPARPHCRN